MSVHGEDTTFKLGILPRVPGDPLHLAADTVRAGVQGLLGGSGDLVYKGLVLGGGGTSSCC